MPQVCFICEKQKQVGRISRHKRGVAGKQWAKRAQKTVKVFKANLHPKTIDGVKVLLCAKCIKRINAEQLLARKQVATPEVKTA